ncbi:MAG: nickel-dependent hydrogenase large subunit [Candidatus Aenigmatarchaeota archaeon]
MHDFSLPIGPVNPSIKEPTCLKLELSGEIIRSAKLQLGYAHKGIEHLLEDKRIEQALYISERICGICSFCHSNCFNLSIEKMLNFDPTKRVKYIRTLVAELERIQSHTLWMGFMFHEFGFNSMFQYLLRDREHILEIFEKFTGGRVHHAINKPKTVRYDLTEDDSKFIINKMNIIEKEFKKYLEMVKKDETIKRRLIEIGTITKDKAIKYCLVGPTARASGINNDIRIKHPYDAYPFIEFDVIIDDNGDAYSRLCLRLLEVLESIKIIRQIIRDLPKEEIPKPQLVFIEKGFSTAQVEAPRGENFYFTIVKNNKIDRVKIRTPTFANINIIPSLLEGRNISDVPIILHSIDPCFSCMERILIIKDKKREVLNEHDFLHKYCDHHH